MMKSAQKAGIENPDVDPSLATPVEIEAAWIEEARQRLNEYDAGRVTPVPWPEARLRIFQRES